MNPMMLVRIKIVAKGTIIILLVWSDIEIDK